MWESERKFEIFFKSDQSRVRWKVADVGCKKGIKDFQKLIKKSRIWEQENLVISGGREL